MVSGVIMDITRRVDHSAHSEHGLHLYLLSMLDILKHTTHKWICSLSLEMEAGLIILSASQFNQFVVTINSVATTLQHFAWLVCSYGSGCSNQYYAIQ